MPYEDIQIRIARDGTVYLHVDGVSEERIRSLREFLEEQIGPIQSLEIVRRPDWDQPVARTAEDAARRSGELEIDLNG
jgi:hypothetical protein